MIATAPFPPLSLKKNALLSLSSPMRRPLFIVCVLCSGTAVVERFLPRRTLSEVAVQVEPAFESDVGLSAFSQLFIFVFQFPRAILFHSSPPLASFIGHWRTCSITIRRLRTTAFAFLFAFSRNGYWSKWTIPNQDRIQTQILKQNTQKTTK